MVFVSRCGVRFGFRFHFVSSEDDFLLVPQGGYALAQSYSDSSELGWFSSLSWDAFVSKLRCFRPVKTNATSIRASASDLRDRLN